MKTKIYTVNVPEFGVTEFHRRGKCEEFGDIFKIKGVVCEDGRKRTAIVEDAITGHSLVASVQIDNKTVRGLVVIDEDGYNFHEGPY